MKLSVQEPFLIIQVLWHQPLIRIKQVVRATARETRLVALGVPACLTLINFDWLGGEVPK